MKDWIQKRETERFDLLRLVAGENNLPDFMIEKDWWVTSVLEALFTSELGKNLSFKGGTSLSKSWNLLNRFSEDIDIVIDKNLFGVTDNDEPGSGKRTKLRKEARKYVIEKVKPLLQAQLLKQGIPEEQFVLQEEPSTESDKDPTELLLSYKPITEITNDYTKAVVKIEIGVRAMMEPAEGRRVSSLLAQRLNPNEVIAINTVLPKRTFWEKAFLLHELFQKPVEEMKLLRLSRHWYDLDCLMNAGFGKEAMEDKELFTAIRNHRKIFTKVAGIDYDSLLPEGFNLSPPDAKKEEWSKDYEVMRQSYIFRSPPSLIELEESMTSVMEQFKTLKF
ncbi:MAG: nucleotidyl transferase AbiEii/AbiGii toxin family protein [Cyclobacteriaceae bacterium]|nr:nucleotidyl transferase AbiEii/AbiGii toxin family protein [Cyclobacteriaceae bacterium]